MAQVVVSSPASADFQKWSGNWRGRRARASPRAMAPMCRHGFAALAQFPDSGSARPALGAKVRIAVVAPYVVIYEYDKADGTVLVLRVVHGRRRITRRHIR